MAKRNNRRSRNNNDLTIAQAEGNVRYGPQVTQVRDLYTQAAEQKVSDINAAKQNAASAIAFARGSRPEVNAIYKRGGNVAKTAAAEVANAFAPLSAGADPFRAAAARESQGAKTRMAEAASAARQELVDRATAAKSGQGFAVNQAQQTYASSAKKLGQKLQDVLGERGSYISGRLGTLANQRAAEQLKLNLAKMDDATKRDIADAANRTRADEGAANRKARADEGAANRKAKADSKGGGGGTRPTGTQRTTLSNDFAKALRYAQDYANNPKGGTPHERRAAARDALLRGAPAGKDSKGAYPGTPSFGQLPLTLALDMAFDKHISRAHGARLHGLGYKVADLSGARSYVQWLGTPEGQAWQRAQNRPKSKPGKPVNNVFTASPFGRRF
jgi:hypothetical protein